METQKKEAATAAKEKVTLINHDQILAILKATMGKTPVKHFAEHLKVVSHQFLSKVLSGDYFIGPKLAKAIGYEQVVRFRPVKLSAKENDVLAAVEQLKAAGARPMGVPFSKDDILKGVAAFKTLDVRPRKAKPGKVQRLSSAAIDKKLGKRKAKAIRKKK